MRMKILLTVFMVLGLCGLVSGQNFERAIFGNAADTSSAVKIGKNKIFTAIIVPDDINSDAITFLASQDGTNYYKLFRSRPAQSGTTTVDSTGAYTLIPDTAAVYWAPLPEAVFRNVRQLKIILDAATSSSADTVKVLYE